MKRLALVLACVVVASPAYAQLGGLKKRIGQAQDAKAKVDKLSDLVVSEKEERQIGEEISALLIDRFGVYQDKAVTKYVTLVGSVLAQESSRPSLAWEFIVLDTDGVNAYAAPGGLIHITRGALGLIRNEAELAGVLGHEITHVTAKHTVKAIQNSSRVAFGAEHSGQGGLTRAGISLLAGAGFEILFQNGFNRGDEMESDETGIQLANKIGYSPSGMIGFLNKIAERNKDMKEPNGFFASHPQIGERITAMQKVIKDSRLNATATVEARYKDTITFDAKPASAIAMDIAGVRGAVGDTAKAEPEKEKKSGGLLGKFKASSGDQAKNSQTVASAGSRGGVPDRDAVGGPNKRKLAVPVTAAEIAAFRKAIA